jgi:hypothetical protein
VNDSYPKAIVKKKKKNRFEYMWKKKPPPGGGSFAREARGIGDGCESYGISRRGGMILRGATVVLMFMAMSLVVLFSPHNSPWAARLFPVAEGLRRTGREAAKGKPNAAASSDSAASTDCQEGGDQPCEKKHLEIVFRDFELPPGLEDNITRRGYTQRVIAQAQARIEKVMLETALERALEVISGKSSEESMTDASEPAPSTLGSKTIDTAHSEDGEKTLQVEGGGMAAEGVSSTSITDDGSVDVDVFAKLTGTDASIPEASSGEGNTDMGYLKGGGKSSQSQQIGESTTDNSGWKSGSYINRQLMARSLPRASGPRFGGPESAQDPWINAVARRQRMEPVNRSSFRRSSSVMPPLTLFSPGFVSLTRYRKGRRPRQGYVATTGEGSSRVRTPRASALASNSIGAFQNEDGDESGSWTRSGSRQRAGNIDNLRYSASAYGRNKQQEPPSFSVNLAKEKASNPARRKNRPGMTPRTTDGLIPPEELDATSPFILSYFEKALRSDNVGAGENKRTMTTLRGDMAQGAALNGNDVVVSFVFAGQSSSVSYSCPRSAVVFLRPQDYPECGGDTSRLGPAQKPVPKNNKSSKQQGESKSGSGMRNNNSSKGSSATRGAKNDMVQGKNNSGGAGMMMKNRNLAGAKGGGDMGGSAKQSRGMAAGAGGNGNFGGIRCGIPGSIERPSDMSSVLPRDRGSSKSMSNSKLQRSAKGASGMSKNASSGSKAVVKMMMNRRLSSSKSSGAASAKGSRNKGRPGSGQGPSRGDVASATIGGYVGFDLNGRRLLVPDLAACSPVSSGGRPRPSMNAGPRQSHSLPPRGRFPKGTGMTSSPTRPTLPTATARPTKEAVTAGTMAPGSTAIPTAMSQPTKSPKAGVVPMPTASPTIETKTKPTSTGSPIPATSFPSAILPIIASRRPTQRPATGEPTILPTEAATAILPFLTPTLMDRTVAIKSAPMEVIGVEDDMTGFTPIELVLGGRLFFTEQAFLGKLTTV